MPNTVNDNTILKITKHKAKLPNYIVQLKNSEKVFDGRPCSQFLKCFVNIKLLHFFKTSVRTFHILAPAYVARPLLCVVEVLNRQAEAFFAFLAL